MKHSDKIANNASVNAKLKMKRKRWFYGNICLLCLGLALVSTGLTLLVFFTPIYDFIINNALVISPTSKAYKAWQINDPPLIMDVYLFNWTNPEDINNHSVKPNFEEVGPYRYKEVKEKINITWNDNGTITYRHKKSFYFDAENSLHQLSDIITTINTVPLTAAYKAKNWGLITKSSLSFTLNSLTTLYVTKTAGELLFEGYEDSFLSAAGIVAEVADKFGFFYKRNGTAGADGTFTMSIKNDENFGKLLSWNYDTKTSYYEDQCGYIEGSAGEFYPINRKRDAIVFYSAELCKNAVLEYDSDVVVKGVRGYKYIAKNIFDNGTLKPEYSCYCNGECVPSGVLNVSSCRQNSPSFLSLPHFYSADPYYINSIEGVHPERQKHEFYITLEPKSGIIIDIGARMQLNMLLQPIDYISMYSNVPKVFIPVFYFDQAIPLTDELASEIRLLQSLPDICNILGLVLAGLGFVVILWTFLFCFCSKKTKNKEKCKTPQNTHEEIPLRNNRD